MTRLDRRALFTSGAAAALLAATGVSARPRRGGHMRAALSGASRADDWKTPSAGLFMRAAAATVHEGLTEVAADGTLRPMLATDWRTEDGGTCWQFDLREGVLWHDGSLLTPRDVAQALGHVGAVEATEQGVSIRLRTPDMNLPYRLSAPDALVRGPAGGTGLYRLHKFDPGRQFIAARVETHWRDGQAGWFDRVEFVHFDAEAVRVQALAEGLVHVADVTAAPDLSDVLRLPDDENTLQIASRSLGIPTRTGRAAPLDNLRFSERWWMS